ncbi:ATP-binding protein [Chloroflexota bacterium]
MAQNNKTNCPIVEINMPGVMGFEKIARDAAAALAVEMGFSPDRIEDLKTAVSEACMNAVEHGNAGNPASSVQILLRVEASSLSVLVHDEGQHAAPEEFPEPGLPDRTRGWGLFFIDQLMDEVKFERLPEGGNQIIMVIHLSEVDSAAV